MLKRLRHLLSIILLLSMAVVNMACSDDETNIVEIRGVIVEGAGLNIDCEYIFQPDAGNYLVPQFIPLQFRVDGILVFIKGEILTERADCSASNDNGLLLRIEQISEVN
jgi:hypothetical protein